MLPSVQGLVFRVEAGSIEVPLEKPDRSSPAGEGLRSPALGTSSISKELELQPIRDLALRELLSKAKNGRAQVIIPLREATLKKGPLKLRIPAGTKVVINVLVRDGRIIRDQATGNFEPHIDLPLGLEFRGIFLDKDGAIMADISPFPDVDLSWLNSSLRVPDTLAEVLSMVFPDREREPRAAGDRSRESSLGIIAEEIVVTARDIGPCQEPIDLGPFGHLALGPDTLLQAEFGPTQLRISGHLDVREASVRGRGFSARELSGQGEVEFTLHRESSSQFYSIACELDRFQAGHAGVVLIDGSSATLTNVEARDTSFRIVDRGAVEWAASAEELRGESHEGFFYAHIEGQQHRVSLGAAAFSGAVSLSNQHHELGLDLTGLEVSIGRHPLPLGVMHFDVVGSSARIDGHLKLSSRDGLLFDGAISTKSVLEGGHFDLGPAKGTIREGTELELQISSFSGKGLLSRFLAKGSAAVLLSNATLDLGDKSLGLSQGATGMLTMRSIRLNEGKQWPEVLASLELETHIDPTTLNGIVELPALQVHLSSPSVELSEDGHLALSQICVLGTPSEER